jgi:hypothetical protein
MWMRPGTQPHCSASRGARAETQSAFVHSRNITKQSISLSPYEMESPTLFLKESGYPASPAGQHFSAADEEIDVVVKVSQTVVRSASVIRGP